MTRPKQNLFSALFGKYFSRVCVVTIGVWVYGCFIAGFYTSQKEWITRLYHVPQSLAGHLSAIYLYPEIASYSYYTQDSFGASLEVQIYRVGDVFVAKIAQSMPPLLVLDVLIPPNRRSFYVRSATLAERTIWENIYQRQSELRSFPSK